MKLSQRLDRLESQLQPTAVLSFTAADIEAACRQLEAWMRDKQAGGTDEAELAASISAARQRLQQIALRLPIGLPTAAD